MLINNIDISNFNAILNEKNISPCHIDSNVEWDKKALTPLFLGEETSFCNIESKLTFTIKDGSEDKFQKIFSAFCNKVQDCIIKFDGISLNFKAYINDISTPTQSTPWDWEVTFKWIGYKFGNEIIESLDKISNKTINMPGSTETPVILEIIPSIDIVDITIIGVSNDPITIRNLQANKKVIINSLEGTILQEGKNKFADTDMWEFPFLVPGANTIQLNKNSCIVNIKFEPRYI